MKQKKIRVLKVEPHQHPKVVELANDLDSLQKAVSIGSDRQGLIEIIPIADGVCILCNDEGKIIGLDICSEFDTTYNVRRQDIYEERKKMA